MENILQLLKESNALHCDGSISTYSVLWQTQIVLKNQKLLFSRERKIFRTFYERNYCKTLAVLVNMHAIHIKKRGEGGVVYVKVKRNHFPLLHFYGKFTRASHFGRPYFLCIFWGWFFWPARCTQIPNVPSTMKPGDELVASFY